MVSLTHPNKPRTTTGQEPQDHRQEEGQEGPGGRSGRPGAGLQDRAHHLPAPAHPEERPRGVLLRDHRHQPRQPRVPPAPGALGAAHLLQGLRRLRGRHAQRRTARAGAPGAQPQERGQVPLPLPGLQGGSSCVWTERDRFPQSIHGAGCGLGEANRFIHPLYTCHPHRGASSRWCAPPSRPSSSRSTTSARASGSCCARYDGLLVWVGLCCVGPSVHSFAHRVSRVRIGNACVTGAGADVPAQPGPPAERRWRRGGGGWGGRWGWGAVCRRWARQGNHQGVDAVLVVAPGTQARRAHLCVVVNDLGLSVI